MNGQFDNGQRMVTEGELNPTIKLFPEGKAPILVDFIAQGGGRRGAALSGFLFGLGRFEDIVIESGSGTSAGLMALAVQADGQSKEARDPAHSRQDTRLGQAQLYQTVTEYSPYNLASQVALQTRHNMELGQKVMSAAPFAALSPRAFADDVEQLGHDIGEQFKTYSTAMTRASRFMVDAMTQSLFGFGKVERLHPLVAVLQDVIGNIKAITDPAAPLIVGNVVRVEDGQEYLVHNRGPMSLKHIVASAALPPYLPTINLPDLGECRDGALGGANPPLVDFYRLKRALMPNAKAKTAILYNLSDPDGSLKAELQARDPALHVHFIHAMERQRQERAEVMARGDIRLLTVQAALTREQREESLSDTSPDKMRAMFKAGQKQGEEMGFRLLGEALGQDARALANRSARLATPPAKAALEHH